MSKTTKACNRFSNENIFKEREKDFLKNEKTLSMKNKNKTSIDFFFKKKKEKRNNVYSSFLSTSTTFLLKEISDISIRQNLWDKIFSNFNELKQKNEERKNDTSKSNNIYQKNNYNIGLRNEMYLTGFHSINNSKYLSSYNKNNDSSINMNDFNKIKKNLINKERSIENIMYNTHSKSLLLSNNSTKNKNANLLKYFEEQKNNYSKGNISSKDMDTSFAGHKAKERNYKNLLIKTKTNKIKLKKESLKNYMTKLKAFIILKQETKVNDEKKSNLINNYQNSLYYYNDKYKNLSKNIILLNRKFLGKLVEYMKFLNMKIEEEKNRDAHLINKIIISRDKIRQLTNKLKAKESQKNQILKWIYFQIQVKEKIL
jgi:hypothetical protein